MDEAPAVGAAQGFEELNNELSNSIVAPTSIGGNPDDDLDHPDDDEIGLDQSDDRKGLARIRAELALRGYAILETSHGYLIGRWGWSRIAPDLRACGAFLRQIGGPR